MGGAVQWLPQLGPTDLPDFVDRINCSLKGSLSGTVRMETPVIYFYAPREMTVDVRVRFPQGVITEWFPRLTGVSNDIINNAFKGDIAWTNVRVRPGARAQFPNGARARITTTSRARPTRRRYRSARTRSAFSSIAASGAFRRRSRRQ